MPDSIELRLFGENRLDPKPHDGLLTYSPSVELSARAAGPNTLQIWRSNGQTVAKSSQRGERESVQALRWKADGQFLAVGWSDGVVRLMGLETSKAVHQMPVCEAGKTRITCIGWTCNNVGKRLSNSRGQASGATWEKLASGVFGASDHGALVDLPRELAFLEVETALPKLSPLPASGGSGDDMFVFTTRASLEFMFRPFSPRDSDRVDVMIVGTDDGRVHLSIYDSFVIGSFAYNLSSSVGSASALELCSHASHPDLSTHSLLFKPANERASRAVYLVPLDLTFIHSSPETLSLLASKITTLQKLLRYTKQVQVQMMSEWQSTQELPNRFLNSITETLKEAGSYGDMGIAQALYHTVVTGHTFPEVKEWLVDQLAERGHKRWDKAVVAGLQTLRGLVHENFLPALERIGILLSRLLGIARFHESKDEIGFTSSQITRIMDVVSCLMMAGNKILLVVMEELELFHSFSSWLRHEIDRLASSSASDELTEKEATMDHGKVLAYIQRYMLASPIRHYLSSVSKEDADSYREQADNGTSLLDMLDQHVNKLESGTSTSAGFSQVDFLRTYLDTKAESVFEGIAEAEKRCVRFGNATRIEMTQIISNFDIKMLAAREQDNTKSLAFTALAVDTEDSNVYIFRTAIDLVNGISGETSTMVSCLSLGDGKILDLKFLYEDSLLVLWASRDKNDPLRIIRIPHQSGDLGYQAYEANAPVSAQSLSNAQLTSLFVNFTVPCEPGFTPVQMEVKEASSERGALPPRVCLLGGDQQTYKIFALPEDPFESTGPANQSGGGDAMG